MQTVVLWIAVLAVAQIWVLRDAFRENTGLGLLVLLVPPVGLFYSLLHWEELKIPIILYFLGIPLLWFSLTTDPVGLAGGDILEVRTLAREVAQATRQYREETQQIPEDSAALVATGYLTDSQARDPWGTYFQIEEFRGKMVVWSKGPDTLDGGGDNFSFSFPWQD